MKRSLAWFGLGFALAELAAAYLPPWVTVPAAALLLCLCVWCALHARRAPLPPFLGAVCGLAYFAVFFAVFVQPVQAMAGQTVTATAIVETDAAAAYQTCRMRGTLRLVEIDGRRTNIRVRCESFPAEAPGECFTAQFAFTPLEQDRYRMNRQSHGVYLQAEYVGDYRAQAASRAPQFALYRLRQYWSGLLRTWMPQQLAGLEAAMLLGDKSGLASSDSLAFRTAGVSHLLAVSGLHLTLLCGVFLLGAGRRYRFWRPAILLQATAAMFFMALTGLPVSVLRAGLVFLLAMLGNFFLQPVDLLTSTGAAAILLGLQNAYVPCDLGFQLSFCAVLGVQAAGALARWENEKFTAAGASHGRQLAARCVLGPLQSVQTAAMAELATLPVLVAHRLTVSGVGVLCNLLVVWMLQPALLLGIAVIAFGMVPPLGPLMHAASLLLAIWLRWMRGLVVWCASLPGARLSLPRVYTLAVLAILGLLAAVFWYARRMVWYIPAFALCASAAVALGVVMQRDVVTVALVGAGNNPCVVCTQNGRAVVLLRGGKTNLDAVGEYLAEHGGVQPEALYDLRKKPSSLDYGVDAVTILAEGEAFARCTVLDGLTLDLYHNGSGNLAVLGVGERHIAAMAGNIKLDTPVSVDVLCAAGALSDSVRADSILCATDSPRWLEQLPDDAALYYGSEEPAVLLRPGRSMIYEEASPLAVQ